MKAVSTLILGLCTAVATVAFATPHARQLTVTTSHQAVIAAMPIPTCGPSGCNGKGTGLLAAMPIPTCGPSGCNGKGRTGFLS